MVCKFVEVVTGSSSESECGLVVFGHGFRYSLQLTLPLTCAPRAGPAAFLAVAWVWVCPYPETGYRSLGMVSLYMWPPLRLRSHSSRSFL